MFLEKYDNFYEDLYLLYVTDEKGIRDKRIKNNLIME